MGIALYFQYLTSAVSLGLGCGICCSPFISLILSSYTLSHAQSVRKTINIILNFFMGKMVAIVLVCSLSSMIGKQWIDENGYIGIINLNNLIESGFLIVGIILICNWLYQRKWDKNSKCGNNCPTHNNQNKTLEIKQGKWPSYVVGFLYGITPCAPMVILAGYSLTLSLPNSIIMAIIFAIASSISPLLIVIFVAGILSKKMYQEIPKWIEWIRLFSYILIVIISLIMFFTGNK